MLAMERPELAADSKYRAYVSSVEKTLKLFEDPNEWADLIAALGKLCKVLHTFSKFKTVPRCIIVSKRLSQCLHPSLPSGVHLKALECYRKIFDILGVDGLACQLNLFSAGLYPLMLNASITVKKALFDIYEKYFIALGAQLKPGLSGFLCGVLPAAEEGSEFFERSLNMLSQVCDAVGAEEFYSALWNCVIFSSQTRLPALTYVLAKFDRRLTFTDQKFIMGHNLEEMVEALCCAAKDGSPLVQRHLLDFLSAAMPLDSTFCDERHLRRILGFSIFILLKRDVSLNRRLYTWVLGKQKVEPNCDLAFFRDVTFSMLTEALKEMLNSASLISECVKILRLLTFLQDKPAVGRPVLERLLFPSLRVIMAMNDADDRLCSSQGSAATGELLKSLSILLDTLEPGFLWTYLQQRLSGVGHQFSTTSTLPDPDCELQIVELCNMQLFFLRDCTLMPCTSVSLQRFANLISSYLSLIVERAEAMILVPQAFESLVEVVIAVCRYVNESKISPDCMSNEADQRSLLGSTSESKRIVFPAMQASGRTIFVSLLKVGLRTFGICFRISRWS
ncbi:unnamed protein product [Soboliphyme baturini]|uniref:Dopey_N domain-containing protein n=1 Tax=Soboliphyme baturini TaxID=241478 RepID=A0A183IUQ0_9BILA|nr:unnamed protein product [Soboliphyme baturini]